MPSAYDRIVHLAQRLVEPGVRHLVRDVAHVERLERPERDVEARVVGKLNRIGHPTSYCTVSFCSAPRTNSSGSYMPLASGGSAVNAPASSGRTRYSITVSPDSRCSTKNARGRRALRRSRRRALDALGHERVDLEAGDAWVDDEHVIDRLRRGQRQPHHDLLADAQRRAGLDRGREIARAAAPVAVRSAFRYSRAMCSRVSFLVSGPGLGTSARASHA
jgi:hypothetical protein